MSKKLGIIVSLVLAIVFTAGIILTTQSKLNEATKTVEVAQTTDFIPINSEVTANDIEMVSVYDKHAENMIQDKDKIIGKRAAVSMIEGQYIYNDSLEDALSNKDGYVGIYIPTDMPSSAMVTAGDKVDIHLINQNRDAENSNVIYQSARVLHSLDRSGQEIKPGHNRNMGEKMSSPGGVEPVAVEVEVPEELQDKIVQYAEKDAVYLTKSNQKQNEANKGDRN